MQLTTYTTTIHLFAQPCMFNSIVHTLKWRIQIASLVTLKAAYYQLRFKYSLKPVCFISFDYRWISLCYQLCLHITSVVWCRIWVLCLNIAFRYFWLIPMGKPICFHCTCGKRFCHQKFNNHPHFSLCLSPKISKPTTQLNSLLLASNWESVDPMFPFKYIIFNCRF